MLKIIEKQIKKKMPHVLREILEEKGRIEINYNKEEK